MTDTNETINKLVNDLRPVRRLPSYGVRLFMFFGAVAVVTTGVLAITGIHRSPKTITENFLSVLGFFSVVLLTVWTTRAALKLSVPGDSRRIDRWSPMVIFAVWAILTAARVFQAAFQPESGPLTIDSEFVCALMVLGAAAALMFPLAAILRQAAPLDLRWSGALAGLACGGGAMLGIEFICLHEYPFHALVWHVLPTGLFALFGAAIGPLALRGRP